MKRKAEEIVAERPTKTIKKEEPSLTRKKVPAPTTTAKTGLKSRDVTSATATQQFSTGLRSSVSLIHTIQHLLSTLYHYNNNKKNKQNKIHIKN